MAGTTSDADMDADHFSNKNLKLGDRTKDDVYTNVAWGASRSDVELVVMGASTVVSTETMVVGSLERPHYWLEDKSLKDGVAVKHSDVV